MKTITTAKKGNKAVIIDGNTIVIHSDGSFSIHNDGGANGNPATFDPAPFIAFYESEKAQKEADHNAKIEAERLKKERELDELTSSILVCESPSELAHVLRLSMVETCGHWSDLYEGRSRYAMLITNRAEYDAVAMAVDLLKIEGSFGECRNRDGEHHHTFGDCYDLDSYQDGLKNHFTGDKFYYKDSESELQYALEQIRELVDGDLSDHLDVIDKIKDLIKDAEETETGYYDCNGNLEMLESDLNDPDITGYRYDVYTYQFAFRFDFKESLVEQSENEEETAN